MFVNDSTCSCENILCTWTGMIAIQRGVKLFIYFFSSNIILTSKDRASSFVCFIWFPTNILQITPTFLHTVILSNLFIGCSCIHPCQTPNFSIILSLWAIWSETNTISGKVGTDFIISQKSCWFLMLRQYISHGVKVVEAYFWAPVRI